MAVARPPTTRAARRQKPGARLIATATGLLDEATGRAADPRRCAPVAASARELGRDSAALAARAAPGPGLAADERITAWAQQLRTPGWMAARTSCVPVPTWTCSWVKTLAPPAVPRPAGSSPAARPVPGGFASRVTLTAPLATLTRRADRPGELAGLGPVDPWLTRDLATAAARTPRPPGASPSPTARATPSPTAAPTPNPGVTGNAPAPARQEHRVLLHPGQPGRPARRVRHLAAAHPRARPDLIIILDPLTTDPCDHRFESRGHDPGARLRHLSQVRHATCTGPVCRGPPPSATTSTTSPTKQADAAASATPAPNAATTTASSSTPSGESTSSPTAPSAGPPRPDGPTPPNPPATRSRRAVS